MRPATHLYICDTMERHWIDFIAQRVQEAKENGVFDLGPDLDPIMELSPQEKNVIGEAMIRAYRDVLNHGVYILRISHEFALRPFESSNFGVWDIPRDDFAPSVYDQMYDRMKKPSGVYSIDTVLSERNEQEIAILFQKTGIEIHYLTLRGINGEAISLLHLPHILRNLRSLRRLSISNISALTIQLLNTLMANVPELEDFVIDWFRQTTETQDGFWLAFGEFLASKPRLVRLGVHRLMDDDVEFREFCTGLFRARRLQILDMFVGTDMSIHQFQQLCNVYADHPALTEINMMDIRNRPDYLRYVKFMKEKYADEVGLSLRLRPYGPMGTYLEEVNGETREVLVDVDRSTAIRAA